MSTDPCYFPFMSTEEVTRKARINSNAAGYASGISDWIDWSFVAQKQRFDQSQEDQKFLLEIHRIIVFQNDTFHDNDSFGMKLPVDGAVGTGGEIDRRKFSKKSGELILAQENVLFPLFERNCTDIS
ncbi:hypothetical protein AVEN_256212-1 [Araneus ventricosus]|uniref:Uncharacterized protein n=1 Tax=Araneus ventricosus TaxID=182803 RepID=A0A4Y2LPI4_ARAVE|nr:hypothetical protein AVEN_256212-1 [Araneus ventricosus]